MFEAKYDQRPDAESFFSVPERKFGERLRSMNPAVQVNEPPAKVLAYNSTALVHEICENGTVPEFLQSVPRAAPIVSGDPRVTLVRW